MNISGVVLAGGKNLRMGEDKAFLEIGGRRIIDRILDILKTVFPEILIVTNNPKPYKKYHGIRIVKDMVAEKGPLGGLYTGLNSISNKYGFFVACDMPFLHIDLLRLQIEKLNHSRSDALVPKYHNRPEPLCAIYSKNIIPIVTNQIAKGQFRLSSLLESIDTTYLELDSKQKFRNCFQNINTQEEYQKTNSVALPVSNVKVHRMTDKIIEEITDEIVTEARLTIFLNGEKFVSLMCLPENTEELVVGFLLSEGIIKTKEDIISITINKKGKDIDVQVDIRGKVDISNRTITLTTGCGKGKTIANFDKPNDCKRIDTSTRVDKNTIFLLMNEFQRRSHLFIATGGVHSAALADGSEILIFMDDIGRHNAVDKVIGRAAIEELDTSDKIILTSGRISSDIILKAIKQKIPLIVSRSAPTSFALDLALRYFITVVGFARGKRMNVYTYPERVRENEKD